MVLALGLTACGYSNRKRVTPIATLSNDEERSETVKPGPSRIYIPVIDNLSTKVGVESILTNALRERMSGQPGIELVARPEDAEFILLGALTSYGRKHGIETATGVSETEASGGLRGGSVLAKTIRLSLMMNVRLLQPGDKIRRELWVRDFLQEATFETSLRFTEAEGSSSAPYINDSRELLQVKRIGEAFAGQVVDQVTQDF